MKSILFIDSVAYKPYTARTLREEALGGSEATLIRVARGLAQRGHDVCVYQNIDPHREEQNIEGIRHIGIEGLTARPDVVVHFRTGALIKDMREEFPNARHFMWTQDFLIPDTVEGLEDEEIIALSDAHIKNIERVCKEMHIKPKAIHKMHNPVEVDGMRYPKVKGRLGFFSSPHKGLDQVLLMFQSVRLALKRPDLTLVVGNPGYLPDAKPAPELLHNVEFLGQLSHPRVLEEMSKCEVLFYPQTVFAETFGIVLAEANAMGVPVIAHDFGAAKEVLYKRIECQVAAHQELNFVVDCTKPNLVENVLDDMLSQKNSPSLDPRFEMNTVIDAWEKLLEG